MKTTTVRWMRGIVIAPIRNLNLVLTTSEDPVVVASMR